MVKFAQNILLTLILFLPLGMAAAANSGEIGRFTTYPSYSTEHSGWIIRDVNPGSNYLEYITLENLTNNTIHLEIKIIESSGERPQIKLLENTPPSNAALWIKAEHQSVTLAAKEKRLVGLSVHIPPETMLGEYQAVAMISEIITDKASFAINTRIGNRIYLNVTDNDHLQSNTFGPPDYQLQTALIILSLGGIAYGTLSKKQKTSHHENK